MTQHADERIRKLFERRRFGIHPGLTNTLKLLEAVGNPHKKLSAIHVAGTNGKGGLCHVLYSALLQSNSTVGLFTSPHLLDFRERFRVNGRMISEDELGGVLDKVLPAAEEIGCTFFETSTVIAFAFFAQQNVEFAVLETGMGGRLDSTNVCDPLVTAVTGIALDHVSFLGNTISQVATEKAGIIKPNVPVVVGEVHADAQKVIVKRAREVNARCLDRELSSFAFHVVDRSITGESTFEVQVDDSLQRASLPLPGIHWPQLLSMACDVLQCLPLALSASEIVSLVLAGAQHCINDGYKGRMQVLGEDPLIVLDIAHNEQSLVGLLSTLSTCGWDLKEANCVFGVMADKDLHNIIPQLCQFHTVYTCAPPLDRSLGAGELAELFPNDKAHNAETVAQAIELAMQSGRKTVICGSFFVAEQALLFFQQTKSGSQHGIS